MDIWPNDCGWFGCSADYWFFRKTYRRSRFQSKYILNTRLILIFLRNCFFADFFRVPSHCASCNFTIIFIIIFYDFGSVQLTVWLLRWRKVFCFISCTILFHFSGASKWKCEMHNIEFCQWNWWNERQRENDRRNGNKREEMLCHLHFSF